MAGRPGRGAAGPYAGVVARLTADRRVITAAQVGGRFHLDPVLVLDAPTPQWLLRLAALSVCQADDAARDRAAARARKGGK